MAEEHSISRSFLSLQGRVTGVYLPEIAFRGKLEDSSPKGNHFRMECSIGQVQSGMKERLPEIAEASGIIPDPDRKGFAVTDEDGQIAFTLATRDRDEPTPDVSPLGQFRSTLSSVSRTFPFCFLPFSFRILPSKGELLTCLRLAVPLNAVARNVGEESGHLVTHAFEEKARGHSSSYSRLFLSGDEYAFQLQLRYKPFTALRKAITPVLLVATGILLNLAAALMGGPGWREDPRVLLALLATNASTIAALASLPSGQNTLNPFSAIRMVGVLIMIYMTALAREGNIPGLVVTFDAILKGIVLWILFCTVMAFLFYPWRSGEAFQRPWFWGLVVTVVLWLGAVFFMPPPALAKLLADGFAAPADSSTRGARTGRGPRGRLPRPGVRCRATQADRPAPPVHGRQGSRARHAVGSAPGLTVLRRAPGPDSSEWGARGAVRVSEHVPGSVQVSYPGLVRHPPLDPLRRRGEVMYVSEWCRYHGPPRSLPDATDAEGIA